MPKIEACKPKKGIQCPGNGMLVFRASVGGIEQALISTLTNLDDGVVLDPGSGRTLGTVGPCLCECNRLEVLLREVSMLFKIHFRI